MWCHDDVSGTECRLGRVLCVAAYNGERPHESLNNLTLEEYRLMAETDLLPENSARLN